MNSYYKENKNSIEKIEFFVSKICRYNFYGISIKLQKIFCIN